MMIGQVGQALRDDLGGGHPIHARHVDVHDDDVGAQLHGDLDRLLTRPGRPGHVEIPLEAEKPREVIPRLRDVVDDEDLDHVVFPWMLRCRWLGAAYGAGGSSTWMMSGIGIPKRSTRILKVMPVVSSTTVSSGGAKDRGQRAEDALVVLRELDDLGVRRRCRRRR